MTVLNVNGRDGFVVAYEIPEDQLEQAAARVAQTMPKEPETPVTVVDLRGYSQVTLAGVAWVKRQDASWTMQPDPLPPADGNARSVELSMNKGTIRQVGLARTGAPRAVALRSATRDPFGRIPDGNIEPRSLSSSRWHGRPSDHEGAFTAGGASAPATWLDVYDLSSGERVQEFRFTYAADLLAVSPSAARCVLLENTEEGRIDVYDLANSENVASWRPYSTEVDELAGLIVSAAMPSEDVVVTLSGAGKLIAWKLPGDTARNVEALCAADNASLPAFSPGGRYLSYSDGQAYFFVEIATERSSAALPTSATCRPWPFIPTGLAALCSPRQGGYYLFTVDIASGETAARSRYRSSLRT